MNCLLLDEVVLGGRGRAQRIRGDRVARAVIAGEHGRPGDIPELRAVLIKRR